MRHVLILERITVGILATHAPPEHLNRRRVHRDDEELSQVSGRRFQCEEWVEVGYEARGQPRELRFDWRVFEPPPAPSGVQLSAAEPGLAAFLGVDARTVAVRRAKKFLFFPDKMETERQSGGSASPTLPADTSESRLGQAPAQSGLRGRGFLT